MTAKSTRKSAANLNLNSQQTLSRSIPKVASGIPFEVYAAWVFPWVKSEHAATGKWPMPAQDFLDQPAHFFEQVSMPGLSLQVLSPQAEYIRHRHPKSSLRTNFNYRQSPYWTAAGQLIDAQAHRPVAADLRFGCQLVLSLILAWMQFPLFNTGGRAGEWMTLGCDRMCKELRLTSRNVLSYIYELEHCGLVVPGRLETGLIGREDYDLLKADVASMGELLAEMPGVETATSFLHQRCVQIKSTFYRLKAGIARPFLPVFNPFAAKVEAETTEKDVGRTWEQGKKDVQGQFSLEMGEKRTSTTSFPRPHDHDYEHEHESKLDLKEEEKEKDLKGDMNPSQLVRFSFLKEIHLSFPGCKCGPLDQAVAASLAIDHQEPALQAALKKVKRDWAKNGHLIENPVALFITEIPKQAARLAQGAGWTRPAKKSSNSRIPQYQALSKKNPIDFDNYTTGKYAHLTGH